VDGGRFAYRFDPTAVSQRIPIYDIENRRTRRKELGRVLHLTFLAQQKTPEGTPVGVPSRRGYSGRRSAVPRARSGKAAGEIDSPRRKTRADR
jgi:hypothetical protein